MMWLDHYLFCGVSVSPTTNFQTIAERLAANTKLPLGKYLLGALYHTLHQVAVKLIKNESIGNVGGPWWLLQLWVNLYTHQFPNRPSLSSLSFPTEYPDGADHQVARATSLGEATTVIEGEKLNADSMARWFQIF